METLGRAAGDLAAVLNVAVEASAVEVRTSLGCPSPDPSSCRQCSSLPVTMEIRDTVNGYPGFNVLPFATSIKNPSDVNTSGDGQTATKFTFTETETAPQWRLTFSSS